MEEQKKDIYFENKQQFEILFDKGEINVLHTIGNVDLISLSQKMTVARKNYLGIEGQYDYEIDAIKYLQQQLKERYNHYFPQIYKIDETNKHIYMEKMEGPLNYYISYLKNFQSNPNEFINLFQSITDCLIAMHEVGIVHGDIKLENILFSKNYSLKLCDFGHSTKVQNADAISYLKRGTKGYVDERLQTSWDRNKVECYNEFKFDTHALGVSLFKCLTKDDYEVKQSKFLINPDKLRVYWDIISKKSPSVKNWSMELKNFFVKLISPNEQNRILVRDIPYDLWFQSITKKHEIEMEIEDNVQYKNESSDNRCSKQTTLDLLMQAERNLMEFLEGESYEEEGHHLQLNQNRSAKSISAEVLMKSDFKSQLNPQQILIILLSSAREYFSNWRDEDFLSEKEYTIKGRYDYKEEQYEIKNEIDIENIDVDDYDEDFSDLFISSITNKSINFTIRIWQIEQNDKQQLQSWVEIIHDNNLNDMKFNEIASKIIHKIKEF